MDAATAAELLNALADRISEQNDGRNERPYTAVAHARAKEIAEMEALRRLQATGSLDAALDAGIHAFVREIHHFGPLSFTRRPTAIDHESASPTTSLGEAHGT